MPLDHSKSAVTISFTGLALSWINKNKNNRNEFGIIRCDRHSLVFDIQEISLDRETMTPISSSLVAHSLNLEDEIEIEVIHPEKAGVSKYTMPDFDRQNDKGDMEDFRWVVDMEGAELHNQKLTIKHPSKLKPLISITDGILYTEIVSDEIMALISANDDSVVRTLGKVAFRVGLDIACSNVDGSGVILRNKNNQDNFCWLRNRLNESSPTKYLITIENLCSFNRNTGGTDFRLFYDVLRDSENREYDLQRLVDNGGRGAPGTTAPDRPNYSLDTPPLNCLVGFLSQTDSID